MSPLPLALFLAAIYSPKIGDFYSLPDYLADAHIDHVDAADTPQGGNTNGFRIARYADAALIATQEALAERAFYISLGPECSYDPYDSRPLLKNYSIPTRAFPASHSLTNSRRFVHSSDYFSSVIPRYSLLHALCTTPYDIGLGLCNPPGMPIQPGHIKAISSTLLDEGSPFTSVQWSPDLASAINPSQKGKTLGICPPDGHLVTPEEPLSREVNIWPIDRAFGNATGYLLDQALAQQGFEGLPNPNNSPLRQKLSISTNDIRPFVSYIDDAFGPADYSALWITNPPSKRLASKRIAAANNLLAAIDRSFHEKELSFTMHQTNSTHSATASLSGSIPVSAFAPDAYGSATRIPSSSEINWTGSPFVRYSEIQISPVPRDGFYANVSAFYPRLSGGTTELSLLPLSLNVSDFGFINWPYNPKDDVWFEFGLSVQQGADGLWRRQITLSDEYGLGTWTSSVQTFDPPAVPTNAVLQVNLASSAAYTLDYSFHEHMPDTNAAPFRFAIEDKRVKALYSAAVAIAHCSSSNDFSILSSSDDYPNLGVAADIPKSYADAMQAHFSDMIAAVCGQDPFENPQAIVSDAASQAIIAAKNAASFLGAGVFHTSAGIPDHIYLSFNADGSCRAINGRPDGAVSCGSLVFVADLETAPDLSSIPHWDAVSADGLISTPIFAVDWLWSTLRADN